MTKTITVTLKELSARREKFCLNIFSGMSATKAAEDAGYSPKTAYSIGQRLLKKVEIRARLKELFDEAKDATVMSAQERLHILTEIGRGNIANFVDKKGGINIALEDCGSAAIRSVKTRLELGGKDDEPAIITELTLNDQLKAIDLMNKMEGLYVEPAPNINIGAINALIADPKGELISRINRLASRIRESEAPEETEPGEGG